jgi:hypothetical protein
MHLYLSSVLAYVADPGGLYLDFLAWVCLVRILDLKLLLLNYVVISKNLK